MTVGCKSYEVFEFQSQTDAFWEWVKNRTCRMYYGIYLFNLITLLPHSFSFGWNDHSLLQPGPCPSISGLPSSLDIQQLRGPWIIQHLPWPHPQACCRQPVANFSVNSQHHMFDNETQLSEVNLGLDWPCRNQNSAKELHTVTFRLWSSRINEGTYLIDLPWPFNLAGFATLNFIFIDYKKYAAVYVCHSLLLEHISIPIVMVRPQWSINYSDMQRMKWTFIKQGILSAWTLSEFSGQCNEVSDTEADWNSEDLFNGNYVNTSEVHSVNCTDSSDYGEIPNNDEENVKSKDISKTIETSLIDPDAEWITSKFIDVEETTKKITNQRPYNLQWSAITEMQPDQEGGNTK